MRLTFKEPNGTWGVIGMNAENVKEKIYGCLRKLLDYENTGFAPDEIEGFAYRIDSLTERCNSLEEQVKSLSIKNVTIGTEIVGYRIFALSDKRCVAQRVKNLNCEDADYVVWHLEPDGEGVSSGVYFSSRAGAVDYFAGVI